MNATCASPSTPASCTTSASAPTSATCCATSRGIDHDTEYVLLCQERGPASSAATLGDELPRGARHARGRTRSASSSRSRWRSRRERVDLFHAPHYVLPPLTPLPVGRDDSRLHPPAVSAVPAEPARARLRARRRCGSRARRVEPHPDGVGGVEARHPPLLRRPAREDRRHLQRHRRALPRRRRRRGRSRACASATSSHDRVRPVRRQHQAAQEPRAADRGVPPACGSGGLDDVKLLIIGDEISKYAALRRAVHRHKLHKHVRFLGFVPDETLAVALPARRRSSSSRRSTKGSACRRSRRWRAARRSSPRTCRRCPRSSATRRVLVDPHGPGAIADAMRRVLTDAGAARRASSARGLAARQAVLVGASVPRPRIYARSRRRCYGATVTPTARPDRASRSSTTG